MLVGFEKFVDIMMPIAGDWCQGNALGRSLFKVGEPERLHVG